MLKAATMPTPAARPSTPSIKLKALVAVTSQKIVKARLKLAYGKKSRCGPHHTRTQMAASFEHQLVTRLEIDDVVEQSNEAHRDREGREPWDTMVGQA